MGWVALIVRWRWGRQVVRSVVHDGNGHAFKVLSTLPNISFRQWHGAIVSTVRWGGIVASVATRLACTVNKLVDPVIRSNLEAGDDR